MNSTFGDLEKIMLDDLIEYTFDALVCFNNLYTVNFAMLDAENATIGSKKHGSK